GVRVGVATARGLALALGKPAIGVTTLEALAFEARRSYPGRPVAATIEAGRGQIYLAHFSADGAVLVEPSLLGIEAAIAFVAGLDSDTVFCGSAAERLSAAGANLIASSDATADITIYAQIASSRLLADPAAGKVRP